MHSSWSRNNHFLLFLVFIDILLVFLYFSLIILTLLFLIIRHFHFYDYHDILQIHTWFFLILSKVIYYVNYDSSYNLQPIQIFFYDCFSLIVYFWIQVLLCYQGVLEFVILNFYFSPLQLNCLFKLLLCENQRLTLTQINAILIQIHTSWSISLIY